MRSIALSLLIVLTACASPATDGSIRRPAEPPIVIEDPPPPGAGPVDTTVPLNGEPMPVDILTAQAPSRDGMDALGTFVLEYDPDLNCLYHLEEDNNGEPGTGGRIVIQWPFGYTAQNQGGKVVVFDESGNAAAISGVQFQLGGGGGEFDGTGVPGGCDAIGIWYANGRPLPPE